MLLGYLVSQYPTITHTYVLREIRGLRDTGCDVFTVSVRPPDRSPEQMTALEKEEAARTHTILSLSRTAILGMHARTLLTRPAGYFRGLSTALRAGAAAPKAILHSLAYFAEAVVAGALFQQAGVRHFHVHFSSTVGWLVTRIFPLEMSVTFHGSAEFFEPRTFRLREKIAASAFVRGISSYGAGQMMLAVPWEQWPKIELVRLGVDVTAYQPTYPKQSGAVTEILFVGSLFAVKGLPILLDAMRRLLDGGASARLRLVGDGPERASLAAYAKSLGIERDVIFEGPMDQERTREAYAHADLVVLSSFAEGIPVVLMEAMAMGVPVVAPWVGGVPELVAGGHNGLLFPAGDREALAAALACLVASPADRARMGAAARATILEEYNLARNVTALAGVFRKWLGEEPL